MRKKKHTDAFSQTFSHSSPVFLSCLPSTDRWSSESQKDVLLWQLWLILQEPINHVTLSFSPSTRPSPFLSFNLVLFFILAGFLPAISSPLLLFMSQVSGWEAINAEFWSSFEFWVAAALTHARVHTVGVRANIYYGKVMMRGCDIRS